MTTTSSSSSSSTKTLTASCHCKSVHFTLTIPINLLPLKFHLCHCSICRYTHSTLCTFYTRLPANIKPQFIPPSSLADSLSGYTASKLSPCRRYFCSTCGCHIGDCSSPDENDWVISSSIFDKEEERGIWEFEGHIYTGSARGGLWEWLGGSLDESDVSPGEEEEEEEDGIDDDRETSVKAECHCGGVSFSLSRPMQAILNNPKFQPFVSKTDSSKWLGLLDTCDDCRLVNGTHVHGWTTVPRSLISPTIPDTLLLGTSKVYSSSPDVRRTFCGVCGATVFYWVEDRAEVVDVALGLLRAKDVRAEGWLTWRTGKVGWVDDGLRYDAEFTKALVKGMGDWGREKYGEGV
ncbi:hypothetical protein B7463_g11102, partial [Scytalidium lignicola]